MKIKEKPTALKIVAAVLSLLMISSVLPFFAVTASAAITPSTPQKNSNGVYQIGSAEELYGFAQLVNSRTEQSASAVLTKDIVVNTGVLKADGTLNSGTFTDWTPIGYQNSSAVNVVYSGKFDGQGHTISGLYFNNTGTTNSAGLFGYLGSNGEIKNVGVIDSYISGNDTVGGVCGLNEGGTITGSYNTGTINGNGSIVGGVCGYNRNGEITGCYSTGRVSGKLDVGGVCGYNSRNGTMTGCFTNRSGDTYYKPDEEFKDNTVCGLLNTALKNENSDVRFKQGANLPEFFVSVGGVYQIGSAEELYLFAQLVNGGNTSASAVLSADITVNNNLLSSLVFDENKDVTNGDSFESWTPIGYYNSSSDNVLYSGTFDGQGHTISGLYFNDASTMRVGLFGYLGSGGVIKKVGVIDSYFNGRERVGGVCGQSTGTITGCYNTGTVTGSDRVGGVCGFNNGGTITGCYNTGTVSGKTYVGGVCGRNYKGAITGCYNTGTVSGGDGSSNVGGVCGRNDGTITGCYTNNDTGSVCGGGSGTVTDCDVKTDAEFADGTVCGLLNTALINYGSDVRFYQGVKSPEFIHAPQLVNGVYQISCASELYGFAQLVNGGNTDQNTKAVLTADIVVNTGVLKADGNLADDTSGFTSWTPIGNYNNQYTGTFDGQGHTISGLYFNDSSTSYVGLFGCLGSNGEIKNVGVIGSYLRGDVSVGGVCGFNEGGTITGSYNAGTVSGKTYVGGVCAVNKGGKIIGCYNIGTVIGVDSVGGVSGWNDSGTITGCYNTGRVSGREIVGGVCGQNYGTITGCYTNNKHICGLTNGTVTDCDVKTDAEFANGTVCKLLNTALKNANSKVLFCQTIGTDASPLLSYQIEEHTAATYTVDNNTFKLACVCGKITAKTMELTLKPEKTVVVNGAENTLTATLSNLENEAVTYKWYQNGVEIQGETSATYQMPTDLAAGTYTYKVEVTMENVGTITQSVDVLVDITPQYYVNIPATVNIGDNFTVEASNVLLKNNAKLNVSLLSDFTLSTAKGASLNYEILNNSVKLTSGDTLMTVAGSDNPTAPGNGTSETYNVALAQGEKAKYSGNYTDTLTFTIKVEP